MKAHDFSSECWKRLDGVLQQRLLELRTALEGNMPHEKSIDCRARISEVKKILALAEQSESAKNEIGPHLTIEDLTGHSGK
jgi:hypothetical protein